MMPKQGAEKQHEGTHLFHTSGKRAQPLLQPMVHILSVKTDSSAFFVILHSYSLNISFNSCSVLGNAVSQW